MKIISIDAKAMKGNYFMPKKFNKHKNYTYQKFGIAKQTGLILFIALIALVVMSLAAAALVRSVDSGVLVAGNLAFKQSAIMSAETGVASAYKYITDTGEVALQTTPTTANGYYASMDDTRVAPSSSAWATALAVVKDTADLSGNSTRLILERMCRADGVIGQDNCLVGTGDEAANSKGGKSEGGGKGGGGFGASKGSSDAVVYRATVRVAGPKNTVSYLQAFIY